MIYVSVFKIDAHQLGRFSICILSLCSLKVNGNAANAHSLSKFWPTRPADVEHRAEGKIHDDNQTPNFSKSKQSVGNHQSQVLAVLLCLQLEWNLNICFS